MGKNTSVVIGEAQERLSEARSRRAALPRPVRRSGKGWTLLEQRDDSAWNAGCARKSPPLMRVSLPIRTVGIRWTTRYWQMAGGEAGSILKRLLFRASARADLDQIYLWTAEKFGLAQAEDYVSGLVRKAEDASSEPPRRVAHAGHIRPGLLRTGFQSHVL